MWTWDVVCENAVMLECNLFLAASDDEDFSILGNACFSDICFTQRGINGLSSADVCSGAMNN